MKNLFFALVILGATLSWADCPSGNISTAIGPNNVGSGMMPYEVTLNFSNPYLSFFRTNPYGNADCYRFDITTDKGKQIYAMLLASKAQCRTLTIYTGNSVCDGNGCYIVINKIVLQ